MSVAVLPDPSVLARPGTVWLDAARVDADTGRRVGLLFSEPSAILTASTAREVRPLLDALDAHVAAGRYVAGALAYEAGYALEPTVFSEPAPGLLAWFGVYDAPMHIEPAEADGLLGDEQRFRIGTPRFAVDRAAYAAHIARIKDSIRAGDTYQVNYTAPVCFTVDGDPLGLFHAVRRRQRVAYGALLNLAQRDVLSFSPELFFRVDGRRITTRPMKGTSPRGRTPDEDDRLATSLASDGKNRAENVMIVDLLRNDLSRVAEPGTVHVPRLFDTERYETLTQMTSTVTATLRPEATVGAVLQALFPCGSVTGAPKLRAMQLIRELEPAPRGFYCGAIGYAGPTQAGHNVGYDAVFNVPIRTIELVGGTGTLGVGSGVVWDSEADAEYDECLLKARFLTEIDV